MNTSISIRGMAADLQRAADDLCELAARIEQPRPTMHGKRWDAAADDFLASYWGPALRAFNGNAEQAIAHLASRLERTPVAVAIRLVTAGILDLR